MSPAQLVALLACACAAEIYNDDVEISATRSRHSRAIGTLDLPQGCMYEGRWFADGATVRTREACLLCICSRGALSCRRRACAPLPEPPPRCHVLHRRGECCPELHCPDRIMLLEHGASARFEDDDYSVIATPASIKHACVEGGTVYAAGSAMSSSMACEQCFCLGGARRCVQPRCLPPPPGCKARPAPGACCPQRYYCEHVSTRPPDPRNPNDCQDPEGNRVLEGERVISETGSKCTQCFCLRGSVRCQHLSCAPPLLGCTPLVQPGQCCPHQYQCDHVRNNSANTNLQSLWHNSLVSMKNEDRSFHTSKSAKRETTIKESGAVTDKATITVPTKKNSVTTKVKRKTDDLPSVSSTHRTVQDENSTTTQTIPNKSDTTTKKSIVVTEAVTSNEVTEKSTTELPEATVKIMINGTINCTTELSSTSMSLNITNRNDTEKINFESEPRVPYIDTSNLEAHTFSPVDIITDRNAGFDENETFTINVTSSLRTNSSHSTTTSTTTITPTKAMPTALMESLNISKKTKEDYDYDYTEPTLPPSLPNLKIIPFVAADAVVEDDISSKESLTYPALGREDKFPVYYPSIESKETVFPKRREDIYHPTQYPVFISKKVESPQYPLTQEAEVSNIGYPGVTNDLSTSVHEYTVTASLGSHLSDLNKAETKMPSTSANFEVETPAVNLFSPPVETEGGFIPKGPGIIDEYYAVYPSTPSGPVVPHLTTSMQLDTDKGECTFSDGRRVPAGDSVNLACSICTCAWGELHCSPRPCHTPSGCKRRPASTNSVDLCCGELICDQGNKTTPAPLITTKRFKITLNESIIPPENDTESLSENLHQTIKTTSTNITVTTTTSKPQNLTVQDNDSYKEIIDTTTFSPPKTTEKVMITTTTTTATIDKKTQNYNHSMEYEDEEEDEGFSFGSVLKLLLSDNYDATTTSPNKKKTTHSEIKTTVYKPVSTTLKPVTPPKSPPMLMMDSFVPVTHHYPYIPPKKLLPQNTINRIDHLVLGEAMAIRTTPRPGTTTLKPSPVPTTKKPVPTTRPPPRSTSNKPVKVKEEVHHAEINEVPRPAANSLGAGLLKLAGCNIYGRMYRVGRIIAELSTPCQECRCTEVGVQCRPLNC
ncbi:uncharacterized protein [Epargyreus clarus]|uniref:uncharacterized protein isoform X2 n=1 Tax=Epargyreus clarus TaxID=520877 RepID=UPI003C2D9CB6